MNSFISNVVLTVATHDYAECWHFCIQSQLAYCKREGYQHHVITPEDESLHPKWVKIQRNRIPLCEALRF